MLLFREKKKGRAGRLLSFLHKPTAKCRRGRFGGGGNIPHSLPRAETTRNGQKSGNNKKIHTNAMDFHLKDTYGTKREKELLQAIPPQDSMTEMTYENERVPVALKSTVPLEVWQRTYRNYQKALTKDRQLSWEYEKLSYHECPYCLCYCLGDLLCIGCCLRCCECCRSVPCSSLYVHYENIRRRERFLEERNELYGESSEP